MEEPWEACGNHVMLKRDAVETEKNGLRIPELKNSRPHTGMILSVGSKVDEPKIETGRKAMFNKTAGFDLEMPDGEIVTFLNGQDVLCTKPVNGTN